MSAFIAWAKAHYKQLLTGAVAVVVAVLLHLGKISADQATAVGALLALFGLHLPAITYSVKPPMAQPPLPKIPLAMLVLVTCFIPGCNATSQQIQSTVTDGVKIGACILSDVLGGQTDPLRIGADCAGAVPSLIVQVIDDFAAPKPMPEAGMAMALPPVTADQRALLDEAKVKAMVRLAAESKSP